MWPFNKGEIDARTYHYRETATSDVVANEVRRRRVTRRGPLTRHTGVECDAVLCEYPYEVRK